MMIATDDRISFSRDTWEELRNNCNFRELVETIEDKEELIQAQQETEYFVDYDEYRKKRIASLDV